jgi:signal transduction histidine kinase
MLEIDLLKEIRSDWLFRARQSLVSVSEEGEIIGPELERFFDLLEGAVGASNPGALDPMLLEWAFSQAKIELPSAAGSPIELLNKLMGISFESAATILSQKKALALLRSLTFIFGKAMARSSQLDLQVKLAFTSSRLNQTQFDLKKLDQDKSDFIAISAHELRTPLTLIDGYTSMLRESLESTGLKPYQSTLLEGIQQGARRLHEIISDMIDSSLIDNRVLKLNYQPLWINHIIELLESETRLAISERQQQLEIIPFEGMSQMTYGDPDRLLQVLRIVLTNAIKFTPDGGNIMLSGRKVPGFVEITISDSGIGIDPEYLLLIFDKFVRLGAAALHSSGKFKYKGGGPGLGLYIAKGIIESHGGTIWAESPGFDELACPGSTFHIMIPVRSEPPDARLAQLFAPLQGSSGESGN